MAFTDLPPDWASRPIADPDLLADVLDLAVSEQSRRTGGLMLLFCDTDMRLVQPVELTDPATAPTGVAERAAMLSMLVAAQADERPDGSLLVAMGRPGGLSATNDDQRWAAAIADAARGRLALLGVHIVTDDGNRPVPAPCAVR